MLESKLLRQTEPGLPVRTLKIEAEGDFWKGLTIPKIRLMGRWLERAGFNPGQRVQVTCVAPGVIELRAPDASTLKELEATPPGQLKHGLQI
jgi:type I toxin-antitoxin system toxin SymE